MNASSKKMWLSYLYGILLFLGIFLGPMLLIGFVGNLAGGLSLAETFSILFGAFFTSLVFSAILWLPFGIITGHKWLVNGPKKALRFAIIANLSIFAGVLVLMGACWGIGSAF